MNGTLAVQISFAIATDTDQTMCSGGLWPPRYDELSSFRLVVFGLTVAVLGSVCGLLLNVSAVFSWKCHRSATAWWLKRA